MNNTFFKLLSLICALFICEQSIKAQTIYITSSGGSFTSEKWMNITTATNGGGTLVWEQTTGGLPCGTTSGGLITDVAVDISAFCGQTLYVNAYDRYADSWDGTIYEIWSEPNQTGTLLANNNGISPNNNADNDGTSSFCDTSIADELEVSEAFTATACPCTNPEATFTVLPSCANGEFNVQVDVSSTGDGSMVEILNDAGLASMIVGVGSHTIGGFTAGTNVTLTIAAEGGCNLASPVMTEACACSMPPMANISATAPDCVAGTFDIEVNITDLGGGTTANTTANIYVNGMLEIPNASLGLHTISMSAGTHTVYVEGIGGMGFVSCVSAEATVSASCNNNECAEAFNIMVDALAISSLEPTTDYTLSANEPSCATYSWSSQVDSWYRFTAPASGIVLVDMTNNLTGTTDAVHYEFELYSGTCGALSSVMCSNSNDLDATTFDGLVPNETYTLQIWHRWGAASGTFDIALINPIGTINANEETCADLSLTADITTEICDFPYPLYDDDFEQIYTFMPTVSGNIDIDVTNITDSDVALVVADALGGNCIASDFDGDNIRDLNIASLSVSAGNTYYIIVMANRQDSPAGQACITISQACNTVFTNTLTNDCAAATFSRTLQFSSLGMANTVNISDGMTDYNDISTATDYTFSYNDLTTKTLTINGFDANSNLICSEEVSLTGGCIANVCVEAIDISGNIIPADMSAAVNDNSETDFGGEPNYQFCGNGNTIANCEAGLWHSAYYMTNYNDLWFVANIPTGANTFDVNISNYAGGGYIYVLPYASNGDCSSLSLMEIGMETNAVTGGTCPTLNDNGTITFAGDAIAAASANPIYLRVIAHENSTSTSAGDACANLVYPTFSIGTVAPQANDICADAVNIDGMAVMGNLCDAAVDTENNETGATCAEAAGDNDLWYSVTMDANENDQKLQIGITFANANDAVVVELYSACFSNTFVECATMSSAGSGTTKVHQFDESITADGFGPDWYVRVRPVAGNGICDFMIQANRLAENNICDIANEIFPTAFVITNTVVADFNFATASGAGGQNFSDLWYVFDPMMQTDSYGHTTYSTQADISVAGLNAGDELTFVLYKRNGSFGANCDDLSADYLQTITVSNNGISTLNCLDELYGTSATGDGYLLRVLQTAGNAYTTANITVIPSSTETPYNNSCVNIWNNGSAKILGSTGIDAAHKNNAYYMLAGETKSGNFTGATDCDMEIMSGFCNGIDYEAISETDDRDLWYAFQVPNTPCASNMLLTYNANNAFHDGILYIYADCGDATLIDCSGSLDGAGETWTVAGLTQGQDYLLRVKPWDISSSPTDWSFDISLETENTTACCVPITLTTTSTEASCADDGTATVTITGGSGNYTNIVWNNNMTGTNISGLMAGDYTVTVEDDEGCMASATVTVADACVATCGSTSNLISTINTTNGLEVTLSWDAVPNAQAYQLAGRKVGGSVKVFPETQNTSRTFTSGIQYSTDYQWSVKVKCDGVWTDYAMPIGEFTTPAGKNNANSYDIFAEGNNLSIKLYPNPANTQVVLNLTQDANFDKVATQKTVQIVDMLGRLVHAFETSETQAIVNVSDFAAGSYFVIVNNGSETASEKLLLIR